MVALQQHQMPPSGTDEFVYVTQDPASSSKNALFLKFSSDKLVEIVSMKTEMPQALYGKYMEGLLTKSKEWVALGMKVVMEDRLNAFYLYKDDRTYVSISGTSVANTSPVKSVTVTYSEGAYFKKTEASVK